jgi:hypothetical protein
MMQLWVDVCRVDPAKRASDAYMEAARESTLMVWREFIKSTAFKEVLVPQVAVDGHDEIVTVGVYDDAKG